VGPSNSFPEKKKDLAKSEKVCLKKLQFTWNCSLSRSTFIVGHINSSDKDVTFDTRPN
jgi:hypothetical protein